MGNMPEENRVNNEAGEQSPQSPQRPQRPRPLRKKKKRDIINNSNVMILSPNEIFNNYILNYAKISIRHHFQRVF